MELSRSYTGVSGLFSSLATLSPREEPLVKFFLCTTRKQVISTRVGTLPLILSVYTEQKCVSGFTSLLLCSRALLAALQKIKNIIPLPEIEPYFFGRQATLPPEICPFPQESVGAIPNLIIRKFNLAASGLYIFHKQLCHKECDTAGLLRTEC